MLMVMMSGTQLPRPPAGFLFHPTASTGMAARMTPIATDKRGTSADLVEMLAAIARGERAALATLYERTSAKLYGICLRLMGSEQDAQDVLHDAYLTVWRNAGRFDPAKASPITWLAVLTRNKAIDRLRQRRLPTEQVEAAAEIVDDAPSAFQLIEEDEDRSRLSHCLEQLDERARTLIRSAFFTGSTYPELAAREGVPLGTMKSWIRRGLTGLRGCLEQ
jgi:RNA polymerase sigma-70 factor (ECF subfamily)